MKRTVFIATAFVFSLARAQVRPIDSLAYYPFIHPELNEIQYYDDDALKTFHGKWMNAKLITIAHFGDSHVQPDIYPGELRKDLQKQKGDAGFGMLFPFSAAKTYSMVDYRSTHTGKWLYAKSIEPTPHLPLGISGATCRTEDSTASFTIEFKNPVPENYRRLKIFCKQEKNSYDVLVKSGEKFTAVEVDSTDNKLPYIEVLLPVIGNSITLQLVKRNPGENDFEFYGMSLESIDRQGLLLHCMGIGGSQYGSLLQEVLFDAQLPSVHPDLVILDFGTNDFLYHNFIPDNLEQQVVDEIAKIRKLVPGVTILLTTTNDMNYKGRNVTSAVQFSDLIHKIAKEQKCPFYDWYWITGGPKTMVIWNDFGLSRKDMVHLTAKGYTLKGEMLADALLRCMDRMGSKDHPDSLVLPVSKYRHENDSIDNVTVTALDTHREKPNDMPYKVIQHKVKNGETLGGIAKKFHVTVDQLKKMNGMKGNTIYVGQVLSIRVKNYPKPPPKPKTGTGGKKTP